MKYKWLNKKNSEKLIIFFNGWGMDDFVVSKLDCEDYDVIVFYDYNDLSLDINLSDYKEKHLIAWSMGVMIATLFDFGEVKSSVAIAGTPYPIHNEYGIPERIYNLTIKGFSEKSAAKFMERMFTESPQWNKFSDRTTESQKSELVKMLEYKPNENFVYSKVIIPDNDLIIPTKNQVNYWSKYIGNKLYLERINSGHCPFLLFNSWAEIL